MLSVQTEFGRAGRDRRRALGLTQEELAAGCGVGKRFIAHLEAGKPMGQLGKALTSASEVGDGPRRHRSTILECCCRHRIIFHGG